MANGNSLRNTETPSACICLHLLTFCLHLRAFACFSWNLHLLTSACVCKHLLSIRPASAASSAPPRGNTPPWKIAFAYMCLHLFTFVYICLHLPAFAYLCLHLLAFAYICMHLLTCACTFDCFWFTFAYLCLHLLAFAFNLAGISGIKRAASG